MAINASIVGATGYTGQELIDILLDHPNVRLTGLYSTTDEPKPIGLLVPRFVKRTDLVCKKFDSAEVIAKSNVVFLALPHTQAMDAVPALLKAGKLIIDLSADYRFKDLKAYEKAYNLKHKDKANIAKAVYGLPELYREKIKNAKLVANPGCYPTCAILALAPLVATGAIDLDYLIIDAKSGTSGAGKKAVQESLFSEVDEDFRAYKVNTHPHMPEIEQELTKLAGEKVGVTFVPHLLPLKRGILETIYLRTDKKLTSENVLQLYLKFYKNEPFVRIKEESFPSIKDVGLTNFCDIGIKVFAKEIIIVAAIDNLLKGASGQAVQNLNIMMDYPETAGLL
ncbi:MAG: N-acetyl-gamma-glutamyl-phosphate reductase [Candidatus Omnitrophica bacterium]|nr:N-acetyl-gamma-glutamyl-phosphate reductase [Candidatus Omnitrophota bacterium]